MPGIDLLIPFVIATAAFAYFPGPALLFTAAQTLARGRRAGLMAALGIHLGGYAHVAAAALGLSAIFRYAPEAFLVLKLAGAAYLVWLGIGMLRQRRSASGGAPALDVCYRRILLQSIVVELLNPKVAIFYLAFLPQFVDPSAALPVGVQFLVLGLFVNLAFSSADVVAVALADRVTILLRHSARRIGLFRWAAGSLLIGLGIKLAFARATP